jgi:hypothetical protein
MTIAKSSLDGKDPVYSMALNKLKDLERQMNPSQITRAKKAAAQWLQGHGAGEQRP